MGMVSTLVKKYKYNTIYNVFIQEHNKYSGRKVKRTIMCKSTRHNRDSESKKEVPLYAFSLSTSQIT